MKLAGFLFMLAGWINVIGAVVFLHTASARAAFVLAGLGIEIVGLVLAFRSQSALPKERG
jgi:uncharacterized membrane protein